MQNVKLTDQDKKNLIFMTNGLKLCADQYLRIKIEAHRQAICLALHTCQWLGWIYWKYIGALTFFASLPAWPWIIYLYYHNITSGGIADPFGRFMLDWGKRPKSGCYMQKMWYDLAMLFRPLFEMSLEYICMDR